MAICVYFEFTLLQFLCYGTFVHAGRLKHSKVRLLIMLRTCMNMKLPLSPQVEDFPPQLYALTQHLSKLLSVPFNSCSVDFLTDGTWLPPTLPCDRVR